MNMADPALPFHQGLARFKSRILMANIHRSEWVNVHRHPYEAGPEASLPPL